MVLERHGGGGGEHDQDLSGGWKSMARSQDLGLPVCWAEESPQQYPRPNPWNLGVLSDSRRNLSEAAKLRIWRWGDYAGLSRWTLKSSDGPVWTGLGKN